MKSGSLLFEQIDKSIGKKVNSFSDNFFRYAVHAMLACLSLTLGTAATFTIAIKGEGIPYGLGKMLHALMFSWSLVMTLYMNAELGTPDMLYVTIGIYRKKANFSLAAKILFTCILFNLIGDVLLGFLVSLTVLFQGSLRDSFFFTSVAGKLEKTTLQILAEAVFANTVVNTVVLVNTRMKDNAGKVVAIIFIIFISAFLGFEHVIVNFSVFSLIHFVPDGAIEAFTAGNVVHNLFWAFIGNFIGGGLIIGPDYAWLDKDNKNLTYSG